VGEGQVFFLFWPVLLVDGLGDWLRQPKLLSHQRAVIGCSAAIFSNGLFQEGHEGRKVIFGGRLRFPRLVQLGKCDNNLFANCSKKE
jgi:hypothetical protein